MLRRFALRNDKATPVVARRHEAPTRQSVTPKLMTLPQRGKPFGTSKLYVSFVGYPICLTDVVKPTAGFLRKAWTKLGQISAVESAAAAEVGRSTPLWTPWGIRGHADCRIRRKEEKLLPEALEIWQKRWQTANRRSESFCRETRQKKKSARFCQQAAVDSFLLQKRAFLAIPAGFEPTACRLGGDRSILLSYGTMSSKS